MICPELYESINVEVKKLKNLIQLRPFFSDDPFRVSTRFFFLISTLHKGPFHTLHFLVCINHSIYTYFSIVMIKRSKSSLLYVISKLISDDTVGLNEKLFEKSTLKYCEEIYQRNLVLSLYLSSSLKTNNFRMYTL